MATLTIQLECNESVASLKDLVDRGSSSSEGARALQDFFRSVSCGQREAEFSVCVSDTGCCAGGGACCEPPAEKKWNLELAWTRITKKDKVLVGDLEFVWGEDMERPRSSARCALELANALEAHGVPCEVEKASLWLSCPSAKEVRATQAKNGITINEVVLDDDILCDSYVKEFKG